MNQITCESVKEKILLCEQLSDAEKEHLEHCEECRLASLQTEKMISDLEKLSVPGIKEGELADRVMNEIRDSKILYFPKFKISNHIGTAAALVIVVAMFAAVKMSDNVRLDANSASDGYVAEYCEHISKDASADSTVPESNSKFLLSDQIKEKKSDDSDSVVDSYAAEEEAPIMMFSARVASAEEESFESANAVDNYMHDSADDVLMQDNAAYNQSLLASAGGGGSSVKNYGEEIFEESVSVEAEEEETYHMLFSSDLFDETCTLEENVNIANEYVKSIYQDANVLKAQTLCEMQITNDLFLEWISTVETVGEYTFEMLYSYVQNNN